jgi:hypothetical protein
LWLKKTVKKLSKNCQKIVKKLAFSTQNTATYIGYVKNNRMYVGSIDFSRKWHLEVLKLPQIATWNHICKNSIIF